MKPNEPAAWTAPTITHTPLARTLDTGGSGMDGGHVSV